MVATSVSTAPAHADRPQVSLKFRLWSKKQRETVFCCVAMKKGKVHTGKMFEEIFDFLKLMDTQTVYESPMSSPSAPAPKPETPVS